MIRIPSDPPGPSAQRRPRIAAGVTFGARHAHRTADASIGTVEHDIAVADSGNIGVPGAPWQRREPGGGSEVLSRCMDAATAGQYLKGACPLTAGEQQMLLAVHEAGHTFAMHATGMEYGEITINPGSPESRDGRTGLKRPGRAERRELPRTAREAAMLARGGWAATETWLEVATASGTKLRGRQTERLPRPDRRRGRPLQPDVLPHPAAHRLPARRYSRRMTGKAK